MTTGRSRPKLPPPPPPAPMPLILEETEEAKRRARAGGKHRGRPSTILAGRLTSKMGKVLLGE